MYSQSKVNQGKENVIKKAVKKRNYIYSTGLFLSILYIYIVYL